jgi:hypothetical protein
MSAEFDYLATARSLAEYFARQEAADGSQRWTAGKNAAQEWQRVLENSRPAPGDVVRLDTLMLEGVGQDGAGWVELKLAYDQWRER